MWESNGITPESLTVSCTNRAVLDVSNGFLYCVGRFSKAYSCSIILFASVW